MFHQRERPLKLLNGLSVNKLYLAQIIWYFLKVLDKTLYNSNITNGLIDLFNLSTVFADVKAKGSKDVL